MADALARQSDPRLDQAAVTNLRNQLRGALLLPSEAEYDEACRIWNAMITRKPALIVRPGGGADVVACVNFARAHGLPLSVRGGGHNVAGAALCEHGLMIDMSLRRSVHVDAQDRIVRAEAGATWGDVDHAAQSAGLVVPGGIVSKTGVAGFTLGGGFGWTSRKFGYAADNLVAADIVTADGVLRRASETDNADLFWATRGGGGNFGVVLSFEFRAHQLGPGVLCGMVVHPMSQARLVLQQYRQITAAAPDELSCLVILRRAPAAPYLPDDVHGKPIAALAVCWAGDPAHGRDAVLPLTRFGRPLADTIGVKPFAEHQMMLDAGQPFGRRYYWKSGYFADIGNGLVDTMVEHAERITSPHSAVLLMHLGGAPARTDPAINAVGLRTASHVLNIQGAWESPQENHRHVAWAQACWAAARPFSSGSAYINFMTDDEGEERVRAAYGDNVYARLRAIKTTVDPANLFPGARNIPPYPVTARCAQP